MVVCAEDFHTPPNEPNCYRCRSALSRSTSSLEKALTVTRWTGTVSHSLRYDCDVVKASTLCIVDHASTHAHTHTHSLTHTHTLPLSLLLSPTHPSSLPPSLQSSNPPTTILIQSLPISRPKLPTLTPDPLPSPPPPNPDPIPSHPTPSPTPPLLADTHDDD